MIPVEQQNIIFTEEPRLYWIGGQSYLSVTGMMGAAGIKPDFSRVRKPLMDYAIARGKAVHHGTHLHDEETLDESTIDPAIEGYMDAYRRFRRECSVQMIAREQMLVSPYGFGMRPDIVCWVNGARAVVDIKTAKTMSKTTGPQTAGYAIGWDSIMPSEPIEERYGLQLLGNGDYKLIPYEDPDDKVCFFDCLAWTKNPTNDVSERLKLWRKKYV